MSVLVTGYHGSLFKMKAFREMSCTNGLGPKYLSMFDEFKPGRSSRSWSEVAH